MTDLKKITTEQVFLCLGSNIENRLEHLINATKQLLQNPSIQLKGLSNIYESASFGFTSSNFFNNVIVIETTLTPINLLNLIQEIETTLGRNKSKNRSSNFSARTIDIDILLFGNRKMNSTHLTIPHPEMLKRRFVLIPMLDLKQDIQKKQLINLETKLKKLPQCTIELLEQESELYKDTFSS